MGKTFKHSQDHQAIVDRAAARLARLEHRTGMESTETHHQRVAYKAVVKKFETRQRAEV